MCSDRIPYTYLIGWSKLDRWYYGVRTAKCCEPKDLWKSYFTSSNHVKSFRIIHGDPDIIEIRNVFDDTQKAKRWEAKVLRKLNVIDDKKWLNKSYSDEKFVNRAHTEETKKKLSDSARKGIPLSEEHKKKIQLALKGKPKSESHRVNAMKANVGMTGKKHSDEAKKNMSIAKQLYLEKKNNVA
jgi:hypothetical protein